MSTKRVIVVLGPTASGKSELAVKLAKKFNGEIISADSRQIYKGLDIGSGKVPSDKISNFQFLISKKDYFYKGIRHHLLDVANPKRTFTVAQYQKLAKKALQEILAKNKLPIVCGGAGFYIDSLIYDYKLPAVPPQPKLRKQLEKKSTEELFKQLKKLDPRRAKTIDKHNRRRLIRAIEICLTTNKPNPPITKVMGRPSHNFSKYDVLKIGIKKMPVELKKRIRKRVKKMIQTGLIQETKKLQKSGLSWKRICELGFEYKYPALFLQNKINKKEMVNEMISENIKYTKRQMTWFKRDPEGLRPFSEKGGAYGAGKKIKWVKNYQEAEKITENFLSGRV